MRRAFGLGLVIGILVAAIVVGREAPARRWWL